MFNYRFVEVTITNEANQVADKLTFLSHLYVDDPTYASQWIS